MNADAAIQFLLDAIAAQCGERVYLTADELARWPREAVEAMKRQGILRRARDADSIVCQGCEEECIVPVEFYAASGGAQSAFLVCEPRDDVGRLPVPGSRLRRQWCGLGTVADFLAENLRLTRALREAASGVGVRVGVAAGENRRQMLSLRCEGTLALVAGDRSAPLAELVYFDGDRYVVDSTGVARLVDASDVPGGRYTSSTARRDVRKSETAELHAVWRKKHRYLARLHPHKTKTWCAKEIAKLPIANGRSFETIRRVIGEN